SLLGAVFAYGLGESRPSAGVGAGLFFLALGLPLVQLVASLIVGLIVALYPQPEVPVREVDPIWGPEQTVVETKRERLVTLARITGYSIGGALLGILIMWLTCVGFGGCR